METMNIKMGWLISIWIYSIITNCHIYYRNFELPNTPLNPLDYFTLISRENSNPFFKFIANT